MIFKKRLKVLSVVLLTSLMVGCSGSDVENNSKVTDEVKSTQTKKELKHTLSTYNATKNINYVDCKNVKFWDAISVNFIDTKYNKTKISKGNIRLYIKANKQYADDWINELDKTYEVVKEKVSDIDRELIDEQYKQFKNFYDSTDKMYTYVLDIDDEYKGKIDGNYKIRQYYALANDVRNYTILLKEYIYLIDGEVEFYTREDDGKDKTDKIIYGDNSTAIRFSIITDKKFRDIVSDEYGKKSKCLIDNMNYKTAINKVSKYYEYWNEEVSDNYNILLDVLKGEHKEILKEQKKAYKKFVDCSTKLHSAILDKSNLYENIYNKGVKVENYLYKGKKMMQYNILLVEYYYAISGKIK